MAKPFDTSLKDIFTSYPDDLARPLRVGDRPIEFMDKNLAVNIDTDLVLGIGEPRQGIIDLNFQLSWDEETLYRVFAYHVLLFCQHRVPVHSIVILLRSRDNDLRLERGIDYELFPGRGSMAFKPEVMRVWEMPAERMLEGGVGLLPVAVLAKRPEGISREEALPWVMNQIDERLRESGAGTEVVRQVWTWTGSLAGINYPKSAIRDYFRRDTVLEEIKRESSWIQGFVEDGREQGMRRLLLRQGSRKFGPIGEQEKTAFEAIHDLERLDRLADVIATAASWKELLETP